jgi:hypothetical protein
MRISLSTGEIVLIRNTVPSRKLLKALQLLQYHAPELEIQVETAGFIQSVPIGTINLDEGNALALNFSI